MATLRTAQAKWERNTANAGGRWQEGVSRAGPAAYCDGISRFVEAPVPGCQDEAASWAQGVQGAAPRYQSGVQGKGSRWAENYRRRFQ